MFSQNRPVPVHLKQVYKLIRSPYEHAVAANMAAGAPHFFTLSVHNEHAAMTVDGVKESTSEFSFPSASNGCFSLASNGTETDAGAFRYVRLRADGKTVLDIDFRNIRSVQELEPYFDCYYFPDLDRGREGVPVRIERFWGLNERGHLCCIRERDGRIPINDCGPTCILTLRHPPLQNFEAEIGFEQCWRRYGVVFGCDKKKFPYYSMLKTWSVAGVRGAFAYVGAHNGGCCMRGALQRTDTPKLKFAEGSEGEPSSYAYQVNAPLSQSFRSDKQTTLPYHSLTFCVSGNMTYHLEDRQFTEQPGAVIYLPPGTRCRLEGDADRIIRIEFQCAESHRELAPAFYRPDHPETIRRMFDELMDTWHGTLPGKEYRSLSVFYRIMAEITRPSLEGATVAVRMATQYIDTHFTDAKLTVKEVARAADVSESYLYQLFREAGEISPKEYILDCRIHYACTLLRTRYYKVYEVAEKCGFSDPKYFMTAFKQKMGISPGRYITHKIE